MNLQLFPFCENRFFISKKLSFSCIYSLNICTCIFSLMMSLKTQLPFIAGCFFILPVATHFGFKCIGCHLDDETIEIKCFSSFLF